MEKSNEELLREYRNNPTVAKRNEIVLRNIKFAKYIAGRFTNICSTLTSGDLSQAGMIGLMRAVERFDPDADAAFTTYAAYYVQAEIYNEIIRCDKPIRLSTRSFQSIRKYLRILQQTGDEEQALAESKLSEKQKDSLLILYANPVSLNTDYHDGEYNSELMDYIPDGKPLLDDMLIKKEAVQRIHDTIDGIPHKRIAEALIRYYGLDDSPPETYDQVGKRMGLSGNRVSQLVHRGLFLFKQKLRHEIVELFGTINN